MNISLYPFHIYNYFILKIFNQYFNNISYNSFFIIFLRNFINYK